MTLDFSTLLGQHAGCRTARLDQAFVRNGPIEDDPAMIAPTPLYIAKDFETHPTQKAAGRRLATDLKLGTGRRNVLEDDGLTPFQTGELGIDTQQETRVLPTRGVTIHAPINPHLSHWFPNNI